MADGRWDEWLKGPAVARDLAAGQSIQVPIPPLNHPRNGGFVETKAAEQRGQVRDWVRSNPDGSRYHIHEYQKPGQEGPTFEVHLDRWDPGRGSAVAVAHWATESGSGRFVVWVGLAVLVAAIVWKATR